MRRFLVLAAISAFLTLPSVAQAAGPRATCRALGTDYMLRPIPRSLIGAARAAFGLDHMLPAQITRGTVWRCRAGVVLMCNYGASLPCGKSNTSRSLPPEGAAWCQKNPNADFVAAISAATTASGTGAARAARRSPRGRRRRPMRAGFWRGTGGR